MTAMSLPDRRKPTPAQRRALEAVRDGKVSHSMLMAHAIGRNPWSTPHGIRRNVIERVIGLGWARVGPRRQPGFYALAELTESGRLALDEEERGV